jgi:NTP pyrophosphatase (non-canonical NTP hydrolase)
MGAARSGSRLFSIFPPIDMQRYILYCRKSTKFLRQIFSINYCAASSLKSYKGFVSSVSSGLSHNAYSHKTFFFCVQCHVMELYAFQRLMKELYFPRDVQRGVEKTFMWLTEEVGELGRAIRTQDEAGIREEMADILAWLCSLGNILEVNVEEAALGKYNEVCPRCGKIPCECPLQ